MIRAIKNPFFLADTFVFETEGEKQGCFVMVNCKNKIEAIGASIVNRLSPPKDIKERFNITMKSITLNEIIEKSEDPTVAQKRAFSIIDNEFFLKLR